jgi:exo-beta-1,3-glucanase (GH17 family)
VRTYATDQGLDQVVPLAEKLGMKVLLGIWIGREAPANEKQIATAIQLAKDHPATIKAIIVGNEVLLRGEQTGETLAALLTRVKQATGLPVTYADVWEYWLRAPQVLKDAADVVTIHILPYWEDDPIPADQGVAHLAAIVDIVRKALPGKSIMVGETGWPSAGRPREDAVPSIVNQARYLREFLVYAKTQDLDYNFIEAFDQPWKRWQEGTAGGFWGVFKEDRTAKFDWFKPVSGWPDWRSAFASSSLFAMAILFLGMVQTLPRSFAKRLLLTLFAVGCAGSLWLGWAHGIYAARNYWELALELALGVQVTLVTILLSRATVRPEADRLPAPIAESLQWFYAPWTRPSMGIILGLLRLSVMLGAATASLGLCFDPRYRDFPIAAFAVPAVGLFVMALWRREIWQRREDQREEAALSLILAGSAVFIAINEGPLNLHALAWCALTLLLAAPGIGALRGLWKARMQMGSTLTA